MRGVPGAALAAAALALLAGCGHVPAGNGHNERCADMRIKLKTEGGIAFFPGLAKPVTIDTGEVGTQVREELCRLVESARFFDRPQPEPPTRGADRRTYTVTIAEEGRERTLRLTDPVGDPGMSELLGKLRELAKAARRGRP